MHSTQFFFFFFFLLLLHSSDRGVHGITSRARAHLQFYQKGRHAVNSRESRVRPNTTRSMDEAQRAFVAVMSITSNSPPSSCCISEVTHKEENLKEKIMLQGVSSFFLFFYCYNTARNSKKKKNGQDPQVVCVAQFLFHPLKLTFIF